MDIVLYIVLGLVVVAVVGYFVFFRGARGKPAPPIAPGAAPPRTAARTEPARPRPEALPSAPEPLGSADLRAADSVPLPPAPSRGAGAAPAPRPPPRQCRP